MKKGAEAFAPAPEFIAWRDAAYFFFAGVTTHTLCQA